MNGASFNLICTVLIRCVKAVMNSRTGLDYVISKEDYTRMLSTGNVCCFFSLWKFCLRWTRNRRYNIFPSNMSITGEKLWNNAKTKWNEANSGCAFAVATFIVCCSFLSETKFWQRVLC